MFYCLTYYVRNLVMTMTYQLTTSAYQSILLCSWVSNGVVGSPAFAAFDQGSHENFSYVQSISLLSARGLL